MCPIDADFKHFHASKAKQFSSMPQGLVNHVGQGVVNHAGE
jgi:hypothetical protein